MPYGYLDQGTQNIYAAGNLGANFADAAYGLRKLALQRGLEQQKLMIDAQYLQLQRERDAQSADRQRLEMQVIRQKMANDAEETAARRQAASARGAMVPFSFDRQAMPPQMPSGPLGTFPMPGGSTTGGPTMAAGEQLNQRSLANALEFLATASPAAAEQQLRPQIYAPGEVGRDPFTQAIIGRGDAMSAYQRGVLEDRSVLRGIEREKGDAQVSKDRAEEEMVRDKMAHPLKYTRPTDAEVLMGSREGSQGRIRVRLKDGRTGTMDASEALPEGAVRLE